MSDVTRRRVLLCATTTGYQVRAFDEAARTLDLELVLATDRCDRLDDPWRDRAIAVRFHDEPGSLAAIAAALGPRGIDGVLAVGDRPAVLAARVAERHGVPWHSVDGARAGHDKRRFRSRQAAAGLPVPWTRTIDPVAPLPADLTFPCVVKPLVLSGSRGVIRADDHAALVAAVERVRGILAMPDVLELRDEAARLLLVEGFVPGHEFAVEGLMSHGTFVPLAIFDKPDPLDGPFFEETTYVTSTPAALAVADVAVAAVAASARAAGLWHGPVHAECRVDAESVVVLEAAARPIGGLCARAVRLHDAAGRGVPLEQVLLAHAAGRPIEVAPDSGASGVMMVPIPRPGVFVGVEGVDLARRVSGVEDVVVTAVPGQTLRAMPEAATYLGFIFAAGTDATAVRNALTAAHACLRWSIAAMVPLRPAPA